MASEPGAPKAADGTDAPPPLPAPPTPVTLSPGELAWLINDAWRKSHGGTNLTDGDCAEAVGLAVRESGGRTDAKRDASKNPLGGNDWGLWQLNDKAIIASGGVPEMMLDAFANAARAVSLMSGTGGVSTNPIPVAGQRADFSCWGGTHGPKPSCPNYNPSADDVDRDKYLPAAKNKVDCSVKLVAAGHEPDAAKRYDDYGVEHRRINKSWNPIDDVFGWAEALGTLLSNLIDPSWWRRVGVFALGVVLVLVAVILTVKDSIR